MDAKRKVRGRASCIRLTAVGILVVWHGWLGPATDAQHARSRMSVVLSFVRSCLPVQVSYFYDASLGDFYYGPTHPMKPHRVRMAHDLIVRYDLYKHLQVRSCQPVWPLLPAAHGLN